jgi:hypothetical protein
MKKHSQILQNSEFHKLTNKTPENIKKILTPKSSNSNSSFYWAQQRTFLLLPDDRHSFCNFVFLQPKQLTSLMAWWSELLTTNHEVLGSIPGSAVGIFPCRGRSP